MIDFYTARIEVISVPVDWITCKRAYAVYRTPHYRTNDGCCHNTREEFFNVYTDRDIAEAAVKLIEANK